LISREIVAFRNLLRPVCGLEASSARIPAGQFGQRHCLAASGREHPRRQSSRHRRLRFVCIGSDSQCSASPLAGFLSPQCIGYRTRSTKVPRPNSARAEVPFRLQKSPSGAVLLAGGTGFGPVMGYPRPARLWRTLGPVRRFIGTVSLL